jgi:hypothetical protein
MLERETRGNVLKQKRKGAGAEQKRLAVQKPVLRAASINLFLRP